MKMFIGVTDFDWYQILRQNHLEEINFRTPNGQTSFKALEVGELFLFKLHHPRNYIVGGGLFLKYATLPASLAWDAFGIANGTHSLKEVVNQQSYMFNKMEYPNAIFIQWPKTEQKCEEA